MNLGRSILFYRYIPAVNFFIMLGHCGMLLLGYSYPYAEIVEICLGFYLIRTFSKVLRFCRMHRLMIYYAYAMTICIWLERYIGFGRWLTAARLLMFIIGIMLSLFFLCDIFKKHKSR